LAIVSPANSLLVYDTDINCFFYYIQSTTSWVSVCAGGIGATGATGTNGLDGATGATGTAGIDGATGATGVNGADGATGATGSNGLDGATGATGNAGINGATGATGSNGTDGVTGATGANGIDGATGITGATGPNYPTFQSYQTAAATINTATFTIIPGLTQTITLTAPAKIYVSTYGGIQTTSAAVTGFSIVDIAIAVNGALNADGGYQRIAALNNTGLTGQFAYWGMNGFASTTAGVYTLPAGTYTINVQAIRNTLGSNAVVGGDNTSVLQGGMTIFVMQ
jgi:hypothetical protein